MLAARRSAAGLLLLLAQHSLALRRLPPVAEKPLDDDPAGTLNTSSLERTNLTRVGTLAHFQEAVKVQVQNAKRLIDQQVPTGLSFGMRTSHQCRMNSSSSCELSELPANESTTVYPGGSTTCIFGQEFSFQVFPGATDRLYLHLGGGGACWDSFTTVQAQFCISSPVRTPVMGYFNGSGENPFKGYTVIYVPTCSGDLHAGNVTRPWKRADGRPIIQNGYGNMRAVLDWVKANMAPELSNFSFAGDSAGAIGVQVWAGPLLRQLRPKQARILCDSYIGVLPAGFQGLIFKGFNTCENFFTGPFQEKCKAQNLTVQEVFHATMQEFPGVIFGHQNSKADAVQRLFFDVASSTEQLRKAQEWCGDADPNECDMSSAPADLTTPHEPLTGAEYYNRSGDIIERYSNESNYFSYYLSGVSHAMSYWTYGSCFVENAPHEAFMTWVGGSTGKQRKNVQDWVKDFFSGEQVQHSGCDEGLLEDVAGDYCNERQLKKLKT